MSTAELDTESDLLDAVRSDPGLTGAERSFTINAVYVDDELSVMTEIPALVRGLIQNPQFDPEGFRLWSENDVRYPSERSTVVDLIADGWAIVAIDGTLPFTALSIKSKARNRDGFGPTVSTA